MTAVGALPGVAAGRAFAPHPLRRRAAPSLALAAGTAATASVPGGAHLVSGRQLRPALVLPSSSISLSRPARRQFPRTPPASVSSGSAGEVKPQGFAERYPALVTGFFFFLWYFLNVIFNILNKKIFDYFPYPYFVSVNHLLVGVLYCLVGWSFGLPKRAPINSTLLKRLVPVAVCHAIGHVTSTVSFAAVAVSFAHTIKVLQIGTQHWSHSSMRLLLSLSLDNQFP